MQARSAFEFLVELTRQVSSIRDFIFITKKRVQNDMIKQEIVQGLNRGDRNIENIKN